MVPPRIRGVELLDDPASAPELAVRSLRDVALANRWFGGRRAIATEVLAIAARHRPAGRALTLLDVGAGLGDIAASVVQQASRAGTTVRAIGLEHTAALAEASRPACPHAVAGDVRRLPFADASVDIVTCSQLLHHFTDDEAAPLLRECSRVARLAVVVGDLRRSWLAMAGLWSSSFLLGFHPVSRHDGLVSIRRGYTSAELRALVERATGRPAVVRHRLGFRVTAVWHPHSPERRHA